MTDQHTESGWAAMTRAFAILRLPPRLTVSEWADKYRYLSSESAAKPGKWRSLPFQREPMDAIHDPDCRGVVLMWAAQLHGKSEILNNVLGYIISENPCPVLMLQPTIDTAKNWSKTRAAPMFRDTPRLSGLVAEARSRDTENTLFEKNFPGGHLKLVGANAPSGLASTPIKILMCDEVDRYPESAGTEGDPIALAEARTGNFWDSFSYKTSTPTIKGSSKVEFEFEKTDKRYWFCPCPRCGWMQTLKWSQVRWEKGKPEEAWYECEREPCRARLTDEERLAMIAKGEWRPTADYHGIRGYHLNGIYHMFPAKRGFKSRLHQMVVEFLESDAEGHETLKTWINTFLAETWEEPTFKLSATDIGKRAEKYNAEVPAGVLCLVGSVDTQGDRLEYQVVGFGLGEEAWAIDRRRFDGNPHLERVWRDLDAAILTPYLHEFGYKMRVHIVFVDAGGQAQKAGFNRPVYAFVKPRQFAGIAGGVWACKGASQYGHSLRKEFMQFKAANTRGIRLQLIGTDEAKSLFYSRLQVKEPGPRYIHFPLSDKFTDQYFQECTAERIRKKKHHGKEMRIWEKIYERNESLDLWAYCLAALDKLNPDWNALKQRYGKPALVGVAMPQQETAAQPEPSLMVKRQEQPQVRPQRKRYLPFRQPRRF